MWIIFFLNCKTSHGKRFKVPLSYIYEAEALNHNIKGRHTRKRKWIVDFKTAHQRSKSEGFVGDFFQEIAGFVL